MPVDADNGQSNNTGRVKNTSPFKVAAVSFNSELFELDRNITGAVAMVEEAAANGAKVIVLPELGLSGGAYPGLQAWLPYMDSIPGKATDAFSEVSKRYGCYIAIGMAEHDPDTGMTYNSGALVGPDGYVGKYRKTGINMGDVPSFRPGNTGIPVFPTEYGNLTLLICFDDTFWEPARVAALKGANIICHMVASPRALGPADEQAILHDMDHSTIAAGQHWPAWNGAALISANRTNAESNPLTGITYWFGGSASIWGPDGELLARDATTNPDVTPANPSTIIYATIDPAKFDNPQRGTFGRRRPELYGELTFDRSPIDMSANMRPHDVTAHALQYPIVPGDLAANIASADALVKQVEGSPATDSLLVFPAFSFTGKPASADQAHAWAEAETGRCVQSLADFAVRTGCHVVGSHVEREGDQLFHSVLLLEPSGKIIGRYRQTHLDESMEEWATAGDEIPVFATAIGKVGLLACDDVRFPEAAGVLEIGRADIIAIPSAWDGSYGGWLQEPKGLFANPYADNTMVFWYYIAKCMQAFTVVANPVGAGFRGSSGVFTTVPVTGDADTVASVDNAELVTASFRTLGSPTLWINQQILIDMRRADLVVPLTLPTDSPAFTRWRDAPGFDIGAWSAYEQ